MCWLVSGFCVGRWVVWGFFLVGVYLGVVGI